MATKIEMGKFWTGQAPLGCEVNDQTITLAEGQYAELGPDEPMAFEVVTVYSSEAETIVKIHDGINFPMTLSGKIKAILEPFQQHLQNKVFILKGNATLKLGQTQFYDPLKIEHVQTIGKNI